MKKNIIRCRLCVRPLWNMMDVSNSCAMKSMPKEKSFTDFASSFAIVSLVRLLCAAFTVAVRVQASAMKTYFQIAECSLYLYKCTYKKASALRLQPVKIAQSVKMCASISTICMHDALLSAPATNFASAVEAAQNPFVVANQPFAKPFINPKNDTRMKKNLCGMFAIAVMLAACSGKKLPTDGLLGEVPSIVMEQKKAEQDFEAKAAKADKDDAEKLFEEAFAQSQLFKEKMKQAASALEGKEIPAEVASDVAIKTVKPLTVYNVSDRGLLTLKTEAELLEPGSYRDDKGGVQFGKLGAVVTDNDGNAFYADKVSVDALTLKAQDGCYPNGTVVPLKIYLTVKPYNAAAFASMKKILITTTDRDEYVKGQTVDNEAKEKMKNEKKNK